jgi:hypothetical protein
MLTGRDRRLAALTVGVFLMAAGVTQPARAILTIVDLGGWDTVDRQTAAINSMTAVINRYNAYGDFDNGNDGSVGFKYSPGVPTAQAGYNGVIEYGGTWPNERVTAHELNHWLGSGTTSNWTNEFDGSGYWTGPKTNALVAQFDGNGEVLHKSGVHFYPYGLNYDTEVVNSSVMHRNAAVMYAMRQDMGLGPTADPWSAKAVSLTTSDALGTSAFNWFGGWSDNYFAHPNADYYTGNNAIRTPLDTYAPSGTTPSFTFPGESLTINNRGDSSKGLYFKGIGSTSIITIKNLILDGGTIHHFSTASDLFQLDGKMTVVSGSTITPEQGNINILADVIGLGPLTIGDAAYNVRLLSSNNNFKGNVVVNGRLQLMDNANMKFIIGTNGVNNAISGASADSVLLDGDFQIDLSRASHDAGDFWTLVSSANTTYGSNFTVTDFTETSTGVWSNGKGYIFSESNGRLTFDSGSGSASALPEPTSLTLIVLAATELFSIRRRRASF